MKKKPVLILIGTFDTKGDIFGYLYDRLKSDMWSVIAIDMGTQGSITNFPTTKHEFEDGTKNGIL